MAVKTMLGLVVGKELDVDLSWPSQEGSLELDEYYKLIMGILLIAFGGMLLICREAVSILLVKEQKRKIFIKRKVSNEKAEAKYAKKIGVGVGIAFIIAGIYQIFR